MFLWETHCDLQKHYQALINICTWIDQHTHVQTADTRLLCYWKEEKLNSNPTNHCYCCFYMVLAAAVVISMQARKMCISVQFIFGRNGQVLNVWLHDGNSLNHTCICLRRPVHKHISVEWCLHIASEYSRKLRVWFVVYVLGITPWYTGCILQLSGKKYNNQDHRDSCTLRIYFGIFLCWK